MSVASSVLLDYSPYSDSRGAVSVVYMDAGNGGYSEYRMTQLLESRGCADAHERILQVLSIPLSVVRWDDRF
jgi:hypothetical protein